MKNIIAFDLGTTRLKAVYRIDGQVYKATYHNANPEEIIHQLCHEYAFDSIGITGSGANKIEKKNRYIYLNELECTAHMVGYMDIDEAIVVNVGTGTTFLQYKKGTYQHLTGTGIGGGTFAGLGARLLGISEPEAIEALAKLGDLEQVNILIGDIYPNGLGWLKPDITVSNFGKESGKPEDVALGIHSLIADTIISIAKAITAMGESITIVLSGGVMENKLIKKLITRTASTFALDCRFYPEPSYGTCLGAFALLEDERT